MLLQVWYRYEVLKSEHISAVWHYFMMKRPIFYLWSPRFLSSVTGKQMADHWLTKTKLEGSFPEVSEENISIILNDNKDSREE